MKKNLTKSVMIAFMRITIIPVLLISFACNAFATDVNAQDLLKRKLTLKIQSEEIGIVLSRVEEITKAKFVYSPELIESSRKVSLIAKNETFETVLNGLFLPVGIRYEVVNNYIILSPKSNSIINSPLKEVIANVSKITNREITGTVSNSKNEPLAGASILVKGTKKGTTSNATGSFSLSVGEDEIVVLEISLVGYQPRLVTVGKESYYTVILNAAINDLNEVVVVGYGQQKKVTITGAVSTVTTKSIVNIPVANTASTLAGRLPGLIAVQRGGQPGSDNTDISIRGFGNALIIVDGVQQSFDQIDPNEIESISILKDASAAIFGARAGNGVVLVTTRRGKGGDKSKINFTSNFGLQTPTRFPKLADAVLYANLRNVAYLNANPGDVANQPFTAEAIEKYKSGTDLNYQNTDWYNQTFNKWSPIQQYNINSSGGTDKIKYFLSLGYVDQGGWAKSNAFDFSRYNVRSNIDAQVSKNLTVSLDLSGRFEDQKAPAGRLQDIMEKVFSAKPTSPASFPDPTKASAGGGGNPLAYSQPSFSGYNRNKNKFFNGIISAKYIVPFVKGLQATARYSYVTNDQANKSWNTGYATYNYDYSTDLYTTVSQAGRTSLAQQSYQNNNITSQLSLNYENSFGSHSIKGLLLGEYININNNNSRNYREGYLSNAIDQLYAGSLVGMSNDGSAYEDGRISYVSRLNYEFKQKYLFEATFRYDASPRFNKDNRWGLFPGFLAGWRISEEKFMKSVHFIDNLKLRVSHGNSGNDNTSQYNFLTGYNLNGNFVLGQTPAIYQGIRSTGLANPNITWENIVTNNIGLDASFWKGKLSIELDLFKRDVTGVLATRLQSLPSTFGANLPNENINSYNNRGFELRLGHRNRMGDFNYSLEGNVSWTRGKWDRYEEPVFVDEESKARLQRSGQWMNRFFGYQSLGYFNSQKEIDEWPVNQDLGTIPNKTISPGDIKYMDFNKDGKLDDKDMHVIGRGFTPEVMFGFNVTASYKGFDMSMLWQGATNFNTYFDKQAQVSFYNGENILASFEDHWTPNNLNAQYPRLTYGSVANNLFTSTFWLQDATYIRLKNLQLGYTLPKQWLAKAKIENLRFFLSGFNLLTFDNVSPFDPEAQGTAWYYPQQKSISAGLSITF